MIDPTVVRDLRLLATVWAGIGGVFIIVAVYFAVLYFVGVKIRVPGKNRRIKQLLAERATMKSELEKRIVSEALLRSKCETIGIEAQKEITRLDGIRKKTDKALIEFRRQSESDLRQVRAELEGERDYTASLRAAIQIGAESAPERV